LPDGSRTPESDFQSGTAIAKLEKDIGAMRNALMLRGFERHKNNFQNAKLEARKKISALVKMVRWYLGNQLFFLRGGICVRE